MNHEALAALTDAVERASLAEIFDALPSGEDARYWGCILTAYDGSIDAAVRLCGELLPGCDWAKMGKTVSVIVSPGTVFVARHDDPARALLIAILKAKLAELDHHTRASNG